MTSQVSPPSGLLLPIPCLPLLTILFGFAFQHLADFTERIAAPKFMDTPQALKHAFRVEPMAARSAFFFPDEAKNGVVMQSLAGKTGVAHDVADPIELFRDDK